MKHLPLSLTTFLKITACKPPAKVREVSTFLTPGGYDFYKVMKVLAAGLAQGALTIEEARSKISAIKQETERKHTLEAIERIYAWLPSVKGEWFAPIRGEVKSTSGLVRIKVAPELSFIDGAGLLAVGLWNLSRPDFKRDLAAEGLCAMRRALAKNKAYRFALLDIRSNKLWDENIITVGDYIRLDKDLETVELIWKDLNNPSVSYEDAVQHASDFKPLSPSPL